MQDFDMVTDPWFIRLPDDREKKIAIRDFISGEVGYSVDLHDYAKYLTNYQNADPKVRNVMNGRETHSKIPSTEIVVKFKSVIDSVKYPVKLVKQLEAERQIKELEAILKDAQEKIKTIKATQGVK